MTLDSNMRRLKIIGLIAGVGVALYFLFIVFVAVSPSIDANFNRTDFDSEKWKKWEMTESEMTLRWDMIDDLQEDHELVGMTEEEIIKLLGEPDSKSSAEWAYDLGMARKGIDTGTLSLTFENGKVKSHDVRVG
jgi:hypothetical protein